MDDQDRRIEYMIKALGAREVDPSSPIDDRSTAYWNIAYAAEFDAGNFALAREYYRRLMNEYPQDIRIFGVRRALERMEAIEAALREGGNSVQTREFSRSANDGRITRLEKGTVLESSF